MARAKRLNAQGLARREPLLMRCIVPSSPDKLFVSIDLAAGEPTVTTHFSQDKNYRYATFDGVGKAPEYRGGILMLDDIYLMTASFNPLHVDLMRDSFDAKWPAGSFQDQWLADPEVIKNKLKKPRQFNKMAALGFSYGMGAKKFVNQAYDQGFSISLKDSRQLHKNYWSAFSGVKSFSDRLGAQVERDGYIVNPFGYRGIPSPHKAFNFFIQSSVSGIMHVYLAKLAAIAPYMELITIIHDELVVEIPKVNVDIFRKDCQAATDSLNDDLKWSVLVRTGYAPGNDFYEAK